MITSTPDRPSSSDDILRWKISGADEIPNGSLRNAYRPKGVMNVVISWLLSSSGICQNPLAASRVENTFEPASLGEMSSSDGSIRCSRRTATFKRFKSTQIRTVPFFFTTGTIAEHQSVGSVTARMTSEVTMRSSSAFTASMSGNGTRRAVVRHAVS